MIVYRITRQDVLDALELYIEAHGLGGVFVTTNVIPPTDAVGLWIVEVTTDFELRRATLKWSRSSPSGIPQDDAMCTFHLLNLTDGAPDDTWTEGDYVDAETAFTNLWNNLNDFYSPDVILHEIEWRADGPAFKPFGSALSPTLRVAPQSMAGADETHTQRLPPQVAMSVTERTSAKYTAYGVGVPGSTPGTGRTQIRNRWGRFYLPALQAYYLDNVGRWRTDITSTVADAVQATYDSLIDSDLVPVMYSPTTGHAWSIDEIAVDDIVDVIRSRRYVDPQDRAVRAIP